ncbi:MAG TPA: SUMF1/EgtB/PvdO family nonheme iron enzyme [Chthoniobacteraceae bacterium]|jgi:hypothetical protein|nr:SUMF1/EgtB/PvdO family nonheme iron enzyme [Chthoniobacteraceae bacterium]
MPIVAERERPRVPNHELVRVIGRGAYGEIWMARSITGALRAVKIVDQRTFESESSFQREFEGMARFEPISRSDSGFVDILHVGRDEGGHFFYYVMELADDVTGGHVEPAEYVPKTLRTELQRRSRLLVTECLEIAISLTRALGVLHCRGLVHRDIKPANVIFVGGVPKIADIGLVAASGQSSFVGTEGYVPPEGPGTVQADLFSLGKVLYEMTMGKDRLDFPALHSDLTALPDKERLLKVNTLLMRACASDVQERYATAEEMLTDLERIRDGRSLAPRRRGVLPYFGLAAALALIAGGSWWHWARQPGAVKVESDPPGAMIVLRDAGQMQRSPATFERLASGHHSVRVMLPGFDAREVPFDVPPHQELALPVVHLERSHGRLELASTPAGAEYTLLSGGKPVATGKCPAILDRLETGEYSVRFVHAGCLEERKVEVQRQESAAVSAEFILDKVAVSSEPPGAEIQVDRHPAGVAPLELELTRGPHEITARYASWPEQVRKVDAQSAGTAPVAFRFERGSVKIVSAPVGATVLLDGRALGPTPLIIESLEPGAVAYELQMPGHKSTTVSGEVPPGRQLFLGARLNRRSGPRRDEPWENSLQMKFAPLGAVLCGIWPVRVRDYDAFCQATGRDRQKQDFAQDSLHPVVRVNYDDATAFCEWLTLKETQAGLLEAGQLYRLPTDAEWSEAAGLPAESGATPEERDGKLPDYPWGRQWPPPAGAGNYADASQKGTTLRIPNYRDGFPQTSPVGSFAANSRGLYDIGGNVWQWVQDSYKGSVGPRGKDWGVLRGGSWGTSRQAELRSSYRNVVDRTERDVIFGFRTVLVPEP